MDKGEDGGEDEVFGKVRMTFRGKTRTVLVSRTPGRPVIVMHEIFGVSPTLYRFLEMLVAAGFKVYAPVLFGQSDRNAGKAVAALAFTCVVHEFRVLSANAPGPWADWIRDLADRAFAECAATPGPGVGVIGLCLTGNLALSAAMNPVVTAPVMSEPALPFNRAGGLHVSEQELAAVRMRIESEGLVVRGYRFRTDHICKAARFLDLEAALGSGFDGREIPTAEPRMHSVFTEDLTDRSGAFRHSEIQTLTAFLKARI